MPKNISVNLMGNGASAVPEQASPQAQMSEPPINNAPQSVTTNKRGRKIIVPLPKLTSQDMSQLGVQMPGGGGGAVGNSRVENANIYLQKDMNRKLYA